jgi:outer membrane lipoprotein-sorting protein
VWLLVASAADATQKPAAPKAAGSPSFDELYSRGRKANAGLTTLTARFTETTTRTSLLTRPIVERGMLYVQRPSRRVALHYSDPPDKVVIIDGDRMIQLVPPLKTMTRDIGATQRRVQRYFDDGDAAELRKVFDIELRDASRRPGTREVAMVPKRKQIQEALSALDLWIDESTALLSAMRMTFSNGDTKLMEFTEVTPNSAIDASVFTAPR